MLTIPLKNDILVSPVEKADFFMPITPLVCERKHTVFLTGRRMRGFLSEDEMVSESAKIANKKWREKNKEKIREYKKWYNQGRPKDKIIPKICLICKKEYKVDRTHKQQKFCGRSCYFKSKIGIVRSEEVREAISRSHMGKRLSMPHRRKISIFQTGLRGENARNWKGGRRTNTRGYVFIYDENYSRRIVLEHRLVMEKTLNRKLKPEIVDD